MTSGIQHLATRITDLLRSGSTTMPLWLWRPLLRLLAAGEPVTVTDGDQPSCC